MPSFPAKTKISLVTKKSQKERLNFSRSAQFHMRTRVSPQYFVTDRLFDSNSSQTPLKLIYLTILVALRFLKPL